MGFRILADETQYEYVKAILAPPQEVQAVFSDSKAGTGKTSLALAAAYYLLEKGDIDCIGYIRNMVSVRSTGFLPGTIEDKEAAYMKPAMDVINRIGYKSNDQDLFTTLIENGELFCTTTSFLRGVDYDKRMVLIIDEAQNLDLTELQTVLTRPHDTVKIVVIGSSLQNDNIKVEKYGPEKLSPFELYIEHFKRQNYIPIEMINLTTNYRGKFASYADKVQETVKFVRESKGGEKEDSSIEGIGNPDQLSLFMEQGALFEKKEGIPEIPYYSMESFGN